MKLFAYLSFVLVCSCSQEVVSPKKKNVEDTSRNYDLPPNSGEMGGNPCPPPLTFITIVDGKEVKKVMVFPCSPPTPRMSPASDGPDWGGDDSNSGGSDTSHPYVDVRIPNPASDPVPIPAKI